MRFGQCLNGILLAMVVHGVHADGVIRTVERLQDGTVSVRLAWSFAVAPSSALILQETVPAGWTVEEPVGEPTPLDAVRLGDGTVKFLLGMFPGMALQGETRYTLRPPEGAPSEDEFLGGAYQTYQGSTYVFAATLGAGVVQGQDEYAAWAGDRGLVGADAEPHADPDEDGMDNDQEFVADTDPLDPQSLFKVVRFHVEPGTPPRITLEWLSGEDRIIHLEWLPFPAAGTIPRTPEFPAPDSEGWQRIWTLAPPPATRAPSAGPSVRQSTPDVVTQPGLYRLVVERP